MKLQGSWVCSGTLATDPPAAQGSGEYLLAGMAAANGLELSGPVAVSVEQAHPLKPLKFGPMIVFAPHVVLTATAEVLGGDDA